MKKHISKRFRRTWPGGTSLRAFAREEAKRGNELAQQWLKNKGVKP